MNLCLRECECPRLCTCACLLGDMCVINDKTRKLQCVKQQRRAETKPSTLDKRSSLLAIYDVLHYITIPLACTHLHIPVTSLQRLLIINGSHMLPGAPYHRVITATQKAKKNGNYVDMRRSKKNNQRICFYWCVSLTKWPSFACTCCAFCLTNICRLSFSWCIFKLLFLQIHVALNFSCVNSQHNKKCEFNLK